MLDVTALYYCLGGPFHPGCELTWPMRHYTMYYAPYRIRSRAADDPEQEFGPVLTPEVALGENGPLYANGPGDLTRWMAAPWQSDTAGCRAGYSPEYDPFLPTFWPARVPNHVLSWEHFQKTLDPKLPDEERHAAFETRADWFRGLSGGVIAQMQQMVSDFGKQGVVVRQDADTGGMFPNPIYVETEVGFDTSQPLEKNLTTKRLAPANRRSPRG